MSVVDNEVAVQVGSDSQKLDTSAIDVIDLVRPASATGVKATAVKANRYTLTLVDGSVLAISSLVKKESGFIAKSISRGSSDEAGSSREDEFVLPANSVEKLILNSGSEAQKKLYQSLDQEQISDELIILRPSDSIDKVAGIISSINENMIEFTFDGQTIQAPLTKLYGAKWFHKKSNRIEPTVQVKMLNGSKWEVAKITVVPTGLKLTSLSGVDIESKWEDVEKVDYSGANVTWMSSLKPIESKTTSQSLLKEQIKSRDELFAPKFVSSDGTSDLKSQDLLFRLPGEIVFRSPVGYTKFIGKIRRFEKSDFYSAVTCDIYIGDTLAKSVGLKPDQMEATIELPVVAEKRIKIVVRSESALLLGSAIQIQQPRFSK